MQTLYGFIFAIAGALLIGGLSFLHVSILYS